VREVQIFGIRFSKKFKPGKLRLDKDAGAGKTEIRRLRSSADYTEIPASYPRGVERRQESATDLVAGGRERE
jgi:hypothetical protein